MPPSVISTPNRLPSPLFNNDAEMTGGSTYGPTTKVTARQQPLLGSKVQPDASGVKKLEGSPHQASTVKHVCKPKGHTWNNITNGSL